MFSPDVAREGVPHIAVVVTDGDSEDSVATAHQADLAREDGIHVFAVGVGHNIKPSELVSIASTPDDVFQVDNYNLLERIKDMLAERACEGESLHRYTGDRAIAS